MWILISPPVRTPPSPLGEESCESVTLSVKELEYNLAETGEVRKRDQVDFDGRSGCRGDPPFPDPVESRRQ